MYSTSPRKAGPIPAATTARVSPPHAPIGAQPKTMVMSPGRVSSAWLTLGSGLAIAAFAGATAHSVRYASTDRQSRSTDYDWSKIPGP